MASLSVSVGAGAQRGKPLSSINLEDTVENFPSLRYKFSRNGISADKKSITCEVTGAVITLTNAATFEKSGDYGFYLSGSSFVFSLTGANFASKFTTKDMLFISNSDIATGSNGGFTIGQNNGPSAGTDPEFRVNTPAGYAYLDYNTHWSNIPAVNISGGIGALCGCIAPFDNLIEKFAVYSDGTTAPSKVIGSNNTGADFTSANWAFDDVFKITAGSPATIYYGLYILEFKNGRPNDNVIKDGLLWMAANRDKGLPPMWKDLA